MCLREFEWILDLLLELLVVAVADSSCWFLELLVRVAFLLELLV